MTVTAQINEIAARAQLDPEQQRRIEEAAKRLAKEKGTR